MHEGTAAQHTGEQPTPLRLLPHFQRRRLPATSTQLVGREAAIAEVQAELLRQAVRLLTLTGPPGVGKTRLALAAAEAAADAFLHGAVFVDLSALREPRLVVTAIAERLGLRQQGGLLPADQLVTYLRDASILLILDNFEHLLGAAPEVSRLLAEAPGLKVLATSRAALHVSWERVYAVHPLDLPQPSGLLAAGISGQTEPPSVRLFAERAQACRPDFALEPANARVVAEVCMRLDGLPLAIELAAARSVAFTPHQILAHLDSRLELLSDAPQDAATRHRTLRQAIQWSYELLSPEDQVLFRRVSVCVSGFTLDAAEALLSDAAEKPSALDAVTSLVRKSLVQPVTAGAEAASVGLSSRLRPGARFRMLETIREYAWERLVEAGEADDARHRYSAYLLAMVEEGYPQSFGADQRLWFERLEQEYGNLRQMARWAASRDNSDFALRVGGALHWFWYARGSLAEAANWLEESLAHANDAPGAARAVALRTAGAMALNLADYGRAVEHLEAAVALNRLSDANPSELAMAVGILGVARLALGELDLAATLINEALDLYRSLDDEWGIATAKEVLGAIAAMQGDVAGTEALAGEALAVHRRLGGRESIARTLDVLGLAACLRDDLPTAHACLAESLSLRRALVNRPGTAMVLAQLGWVAHLAGDRTEAAALYRESIALAQEVGERAIQVRCLGQVAVLALESGADRSRVAQLGSAVAHHQHALALPRPPIQRAAADRFASALRTSMGRVALATAWVAGQVLSLEKSVQLGSELLDEVSRAPVEPTRRDGRLQPLYASTSGSEQLTRRETEVAILVAHGLTNRQIAEELVVAQRTVDTHVERILAKLGFSSRSQVAVWASQQRLLVDHHTA